MALTSEQVVNHGAQVIEQVNKLSDQMNRFQGRLDDLSSTFDGMSESIDSQEAEMSETFNSLSAAMSGEATEKMESVGSTLEESIRDPGVETVTNLTENLESQFEKVTNSNVAAIDRWEEWRETDISGIMGELQTTDAQMTESLNDLIQNTNDDIEAMTNTADDYLSQSQGMLSELTSFVDETVTNVVEEQSNYGEAMLESYVSHLSEAMANANQFLDTSQQDATEATFSDISNSYEDMVANSFKPLIDELLANVSSSVDEMISEVESIGNDANDKTQALDAMTSVLESLIGPIQSIIDRTSAIKNTVGAFL